MRRFGMGLLGCLMLFASGCSCTGWSCADICNPYGVCDPCGSGCSSWTSSNYFCCPIDACCPTSCCPPVMTTSCAMPLSCAAPLSCGAPVSDCAGCSAPTFTGGAGYPTGPIVTNGPIMSGMPAMSAGPIMTSAPPPQGQVIYDSSWSTPSAPIAAPAPAQLESYLNEPAPLPPAIPGTHTPMNPTPAN